MNEIVQLKQIIAESENIVFFGGAGVSVPSGIPDFRSPNGLYGGAAGVSPETILSHSYFMSHTEEFFDFYRKKMLYLGAKPNAAHVFLAELEKKGKLKAVVTQNIDGLHQAAGSKNVFELHGSVYRNYCDRCGKFFDVNFVANSRGVPQCGCGGTVKPDVVLYEEPLDQSVIRGAAEAVSAADTLIVGGTSLVVYPAASFVNYFSGERLVLINKQRTHLDGAATLVIYGDIAEVFAQV